MYHTSVKGIMSFPCICCMVWHMHGAMYRVASIRFMYSSVARHIAPCICHTIRHIHGNDIIPLREVWYVINLMHCGWQSYRLRRMKDAGIGKMLNFFAHQKMNANNCCPKKHIYFINSNIIIQIWGSCLCRLSPISNTIIVLRYARRRMRILLSPCDVIIIKNVVWRSCNRVIVVGTPAIRHIHVNKKTTAEMLSREPGPVRWRGMSCEFTLLVIFWNNVTVHVCIGPFGILLMERYTEIEHVLRPAFFVDCTQHRVVIPFPLFGITDRSHLQGSRCRRRTYLDSRQPAFTRCLLEELTVTELI